MPKKKTTTTKDEATMEVMEDWKRQALELQSQLEKLQTRQVLRDQSEFHYQLLALLYDTNAILRELVKLKREEVYEEPDEEDEDSDDEDDEE